MSGAVDRRHDARRTINHEFSSVDDFVDEYVVNLSRSGLFIKSDDPLPIGTQVNLRFTVIFDDLETIEGVGEVVSSRGARHPGRPPAWASSSSSSPRSPRELIERILVRR